MINKRERILEKFKEAKLFARFVAASVDAACFLLVGFGSSFLVTQVVAGSDQKYIDSNEIMSEHIKYSNLCKIDAENGFLKYESNELLTFKEDELVFSTTLFDYYCSYLTGENLKPNYEASLNYEKIVEGNKLPKEYYTVEWFNENVLEAKESNSFFVYQKEGNVVNKSLLAHLSDNYIEIKQISGIDTKIVKNDEELSIFINNKYNQAINHFYKQDFMVESDNYVKLINSLVIFGCGLFGALIFYLIIPCCNLFGISIGKKIMGLIVINDSGFMLDRYRIALRMIPLVVGIAIVAFIPNLYLQIISAVLLFLISLTLVIFTPHKAALHDLVGRTLVVSREDAVVCMNVEQYDKLYQEENEKGEDDE